MMTRHEVEVDTQLAALWERQQDALQHEAQGLMSTHWILGERRGYSGRRPAWPTTDDVAERLTREKLAQAQATEIGFPWSVKVDGRIILGHQAQSAQHALGEIDKARADWQAAHAQAEPLEEEYSRLRWPRFFLVTNANGHIHSSMHCQTTFPTTQWAWLPNLSGLTEADAVADQGPRLCSVCFPSAPTEWTLGLPAKVDPARCEGSGKVGERIKSYSRYGRCPACGRTVGLSNTGVTRTHKRETKA